MTILCAQPFDLDASGFSFETIEEYNRKVANLRNDYGQKVEEFEISFVDGEDIDAELFQALYIHQGNIEAFFTACDEWDDYQKINVIIAVGEAGYCFDLAKDDPDGFDIDIYEMDSLRDLAFHFIDEGLFGDIPVSIICYLDYELIARDLGMDYTEFTIAGKQLIYRCM